MALALGDKVRSMHYFKGQSPWEEEPVIAVHQQLVGETLGVPDGIMLIGESSMVKQGSESVGVAAQYCGSVGKIANGQVGVYLGYSSRIIRSEIMSLIAHIASQSWPDLPFLRLTLRCNTRVIIFRNYPDQPSPNQ